MSNVLILQNIFVLGAFSSLTLTKDWENNIFQCRNLLQHKLPPHSPGGAANHAVPRGTVPFVASYPAHSHILVVSDSR